ncbi:MAG: arabinose isomerase [Herbinix sp.]|nr:arabinose isomerase [Herbinix sp.]
MAGMKHLKEVKKPLIGLYTVGLKHYWGQFPGLKARLMEYGGFIEKKMAGYANAEIFNFGLVDNSDSGIAAGQYFNENNVDLIFCHSGTYVTSDCVLPVHQACKAPVVVLNLQPAARINYEDTTTGEWLAHCGACVVPEISNAFNRAGIKYRVINGLLGLNYTPAISLTDEVTFQRPEAIRAWKVVEDWIKAASVRSALQNARFGFLGNTYSGMLDMYSDFTMLQAQTGIHVEVLEMCDLDRQLKLVTEEEIIAKKEEIYNMFEISEDSSADPIAKKPTEEQIYWSSKVAAAQERLVKEFNLDALTYYYHGAPGGDYEKLQGGFIVGHSLLTAKGIPCSGEGDLKTALAMKICDILGVGGSFCEIVVTDYEDGTILLGHDGPFHLEIAKGKPILRGMGLYHGKQGTGVSVEAKVRTGDITTLNITQTGDGKLKMISSEAESTDGIIMTIGNTQTPVKFNKDPDSYMEQWFTEAPTHHFAMAVGHNASLFEKVADIMNLNHVILK